MIRASKLQIIAGMAGCLLLGACAPVQQLQSAAAAGGALVNSVSATGDQTQLTATELRQLQSRDFSTTRAAAFASVMTVLLDSGYRVLSADLESGLIIAAAPSAGRLRLDPTGVVRASDTPVASAFVEERGAGAIRVRINFSIGRSATGRLASTGERAVLDETLYTSFFDQLRHEIDQRPATADLAPAASETRPLPISVTSAKEPEAADETNGDIVSDPREAVADSVESGQTEELEPGEDQFEAGE